MTAKDAVREAILSAKADKAISWEEIANHVGCSPVFLTSACLGENSLTEDQASAVTSLLGLDSAHIPALTSCPAKGQRIHELANDPLVYRFQEITAVYGETLKELIHEKAGDGIMSAIDFTMEVEKVPDPKGDRIQVTMNGKFLPYRRW
ncbi:cyanase [Spiribacter sp. 1M153]|uniref:cyanase n=1 Tax=Spiribacter roseus TaxID=1855875 RepID=UPI00349FBB68